MKNPRSQWLDSSRAYPPSIANKVDLQHYLLFDDVCHPAIKGEKLLKGVKPFPIPFTNGSHFSTKGFSSHLLTKTTPTPTKTLHKDQGIASDPLKRLEGKKCNCYGYRHFQANCPCRKILTIRVIDEILRKQLVMRSLKMKVTFQSPQMLVKYW